MNIHDRAPVVGRPVRDQAGRRVGRILAVDYALTGRSEARYLLCLSGSHGRFRAGPATAARSGPARRGIDAVVVLGVDRDRVWGSPSLQWRVRRAGVCCDVLVAYYADLTVAARA